MVFIWRSVFGTVVSIFQFTIFPFKWQHNSKSDLKNKPNPNHSSLIRNISSRSSEFINDPKITNKYNHSSTGKCFGEEMGFRFKYSKTAVDSGCSDCTCAVAKSRHALMFSFSIHSTQTALLSLWRLPWFSRLLPSFLQDSTSIFTC